jgi:hypothetical protein
MYLCKQNNKEMNCPKCLSEKKVEMLKLSILLLMHCRNNILYILK